MAVTFLRSQGNTEKGWGQVPCGGQYSLTTGPLDWPRFSQQPQQCRNWMSREPFQGDNGLSGCKSQPSWSQQVELQCSLRGTLGLTPWLGLAGRQLGSWSPHQLNPCLFHMVLGWWQGVGEDNDTSCSLPFPPASCRLGSSGLKGEHRQSLDRQTGTLFVPGLGHQFGEN